MKRILKTLRFMYFFICWWFVLSTSVHAYIDPSAVTYVIQAVAGVFIAVGALITVFRHKIFAFFKKGSKNNTKKEIHLKDDNNADTDNR